MGINFYIVDNNFADTVLKFVLTAVALLFSIILHELAHGYVALLNGDETAKYAGRLSFNPARHFDMMGLLMLLFAHFGYAKPVSINPNNFRRKRLGLFAVSIAGVIVNIILSFVFSFFYVLMASRGYTNVALRCITFLFFSMALYNLFLCFFNLLPLYPLDGYNLLESVFSFKNSVVKFLRNYGSMILLALFGLYILSSYGVIPYWMDVLGMYLDFTAGSVYGWFINLWKWVLGVS